MTYKFIFKKERYQATTTYEVERTYFGDYPVDKIFHDACCLLDFGIFDRVQMFDENGREYIELY